MWTASCISWSSSSQNVIFLGKCSGSSKILQKLLSFFFNPLRENMNWIANKAVNKRWPSLLAQWLTYFIKWCVYLINSWSVFSVIGPLIAQYILLLSCFHAFCYLDWQVYTGLIYVKSWTLVWHIKTSQRKQEASPKAQPHSSLIEVFYHRQSEIRPGGY